MDTLIRPRREISCRIKNLLLLLLSFSLFPHTGIAQPLTEGLNGISGVEPISVEVGWNLLSLPLIPANGIKNSLFLTAVSDAFIYQNEYKSEDTLSKGYGFWMKFDSVEEIVISGDTILYNLIEVQPGWNLIGSLTAPVAVSDIITNPGGIIVSDYFYYSSTAGYQSADTLKPGKGYWVKVNQYGQIVMDVVTGKPCPGVATVDYGGKIYNTVQIGTQCWLKENMDVGTMINGTQPSTDNGVIEKYCFNDVPANCSIYGALYQQDEAMIYRTIDATQGICPPGWHIPTYTEIETLITAVNYNGNALKAVGQGIEEGAGTNTSGFSALLSGVRGYSGEFAGMDTAAYFWSTGWTYAGGFRNGYSFSLWHSSNDIYMYPEAGENGFNVRCIWHGGAANRPPSVPDILLPENGAIEQPTTIMLEWLCDDIEGDPITYDIYLGTDNPPATKFASDVTEPFFTAGAMNEGTQYFWEVVAKDDHGNSTAGTVWSFTTGSWGTPCEGIPAVEYSGKIYHTVQIGSQCWLKENLDVGTQINGSLDQTDNGTIEKWCYGNDPVNCNIYGGLYKWDEAMKYSASEGAQGICPQGWHIPTLAEFDSLAAAVSEDGNALKAVGQGSWYGYATNTTGFTGLLAGNSYIGEFSNLYNYTNFWGSTQDDYEPPYVSAANLMLAGEGGGVGVTYYEKLNGFSLRCLKD